MKLYSLLSFFIGVIYLTSSCTHTNDRLQQAEQLIETAPDSAMSILNKYNYNVLSDKDKALYGLLYTRIQLSKKIILKSDSFINLSIDYYTKKIRLIELPIAISIKVDCSNIHFNMRRQWNAI